MPLTNPEQLNLTKWRGQKPFHEVYYLQWNDPRQKIAGWVRFTISSPRNGPTVAGLWAIFFDHQKETSSVVLKQDIPVGDIKIEKDFFYLGLGDSSIFQEGTRGKTEQNNKKIAWDLEFKGEGPSLTHLPTLFYSLPFPRTKLTAPRLETKVSGEWRVGDRTWELDQVPAHQAHFWGTEPAASWAWGHCGTFVEDPQACFEGLTARVRVGNRLSPPMTLLFFLWQGKLYRFNSPANWIQNKSDPHLDRWHFEAGDSKTLFVGDLRSDLPNLVGLRYDDLEGGHRFCHATQLADLKIKIFGKKQSGWELDGTLTAEKTASYETVTSDKPLLPIAHL